MKLLYIGNFLSASKGTRFYCEDLVDHLEANGVSVMRASTRANPAVRLADMLATIFRRIRWLDVACVDVYSGRGFIWAVVCVAVLRLLGRRTVAVLHGGGLAALAQRYPRVVGLFLGMPNEVVTPSNSLRIALQELRRSISVIPNAIEIPPMSLGVASARPVLCWVRAFAEHYNPLMALHVLEHVRGHHADAKLLMVGPVRDKRVFESFCNEIDRLGLSGSVEILGPLPRSEVHRIIESSGVFLNTTRLESFGVAVLEAGARGTPIVTTDAGELRLMWNSGEDALVVSVDDTRAMAEAVIQILADPGYGRSLAAAARVKAEMYAWPGVSRQWKALLGRVARKDASRAD